MAKATYDMLFSGMHLPIKPSIAADGASIAIMEEPSTDMLPGAQGGAMPFFGGFAEDMLADIGFDIVDEAPVIKAKQV